MTNLYRVETYFKSNTSLIYRTSNNELIANKLTLDPLTILNLSNDEINAFVESLLIFS
jgi:hypothetical protein